MDVDDARRLGGKNSRKNLSIKEASKLAKRAGIASGEARRAKAESDRIRRGTPPTRRQILAQRRREAAK